MYSNYPVDKESVRLFTNLQKQSQKVSKVKRTVILFALLCVALSKIKLNNPISFSLPNISVYWCLIICWVINFLIGLCLHHYAYLKIFRFSKQRVRLRSIIKRAFSLNKFLIFVSPDLIFVRCYKDFIKKKQRTRSCTCGLCPTSKSEAITLCNYDKIKIFNKFFIEFSNWYNLLISAFFLIVVSIFFAERSGLILKLTLFLICLRIISRATEVVIAFYGDVVRIDSIIFMNIESKQLDYINNWKNSYILKPTRISLAVHTLIELVFLFTITYYLFYTLYFNDFSTLITYQEPANLLNFFLFTASLSVLNFSFTKYPSDYLSILHVLQLLLSIVLIILSLARYIGLSDELTQREKAFYLSIELLKNNSSDNISN